MTNEQPIKPKITYDPQPYEFTTDFSLIQDQLTWLAQKYVIGSYEPRDIYRWIQGLWGFQVGTVAARDAVQAILDRADELTRPS